MEDQKMKQYLEDMEKFQHLVFSMNSTMEKLVELMIHCTEDENHVLHGFTINTSQDTLTRAKLDLPLLCMASEIPSLMENKTMRENWLKWSSKERSEFFYNLAHDK